MFRPELLIFGVIAIVVVAGVAAYLLERRRKAGIAAAFAEAGGTVSFEPTPGDKQEAFGRAGLWKSLRVGADGVRWTGRVPIHGLEITVLEHRYTTGSGKNRTTHIHTIASTPCPPDWAGVWLDDEHLLHKVADLFGHKDFRVEDEGFNRRWRVRVDDENFALAVLSPQVQQTLAGVERGLRYRVGGGAVTVAVKRSLDARRVRELAARLVEFWEALPAELRQSGAEAPATGTAR